MEENWDIKNTHTHTYTSVLKKKERENTHPPRVRERERKHWDLHILRRSRRKVLTSISPHSVQVLLYAN